MKQRQTDGHLYLLFSLKILHENNFNHSSTVVARSPSVIEIVGSLLADSYGSFIVYPYCFT